MNWLPNPNKENITRWASALILSAVVCLFPFAASAQQLDPSSLGVPLEDYGVDLGSLGGIDVQQVMQAFDTITDERTKNVLRLTMEGKTPDVIAKELGMSPAEVQGILQQGIESVKASMIEQMGTPTPRRRTTSRTTRTVRREAPEDSGPSSARADVSQPRTGGPAVLDVLDLKNMEILDVLKLVSQKSGINIVAGQNVKGRVTVFLKNVEVLDALRIIVDAYGWAYAKDGEIIKVMTAAEYEAKYGYKFGEEIQTRIHQLLYAKAADIVTLLDQVKSTSGKIISDNKTGTLILMDWPKKVQEMESIIKRLDVSKKTKVYDLSYSKAEDISNKITEVLTPDVGELKFDVRSNRLVVSDTESKMKLIDKIVEAFDQKDKEVLIEAKILQINLSDEYKLGVDWEGLVEDYKNLTLKSDFDILTDSDKRGQISIGTLSSDQYTATIEALETVGITDILSNPSITTINNEEAKILVGSSEPYVTSTTTTPASGPTTTSETINFIEVGVKLFVTPTIHNDGFITMKIKPEVSSVTSTLTTGTNNVIPVVGTSEAETTVTVKDGVTIVIGGLIEEEKRESIRKVPLLGDIPYLGNVFRSTSDLVEKQEIVIFLTPRIITGDVDQSNYAGSMN